ncbi:Frag1/DRAM/Sfk1 family protein [Stappia sp. WLB 29]|uniref:Frag1/DRAM/Sfk1 family protein n=1 Tax=Stappia sp. WLB 29 TaxID=2925220 RepID=UPI0020BEF598|nr:Frag1/DRAM/Sfk1 family protein [Stappia sp. WLB 29]
MRQSSHTATDGGTPARDRAPFLARLVGLAASLPVVLVPASAIYMMVWARWTFYERHPDYIQHSAPTVSRAITDPYIGDPFAAAILGVAVVIALAILPISYAFYGAISARAGHLPKVAAGLRRMMAVFLVMQVLGTSGMVICTQVTFRHDHDLHMLGSYLFFVFQALSILMSGIITTRLLRLPDTGRPSYLRLGSRYTRLRRTLAFATAGLAGIYVVLFLVKGLDLPVTEYTIYYIYTVQEIVTISAYIVQVMLYAPEVYRIARNLAASGTWRLEGAAAAA